MGTRMKLLKGGLPVVLIATLITLGLPTQAFAAGSAESNTMIAATNTQRTTNNLPALYENSSLNSVAQSWAQQMAANNQMSHNPNYSKQIPQGWWSAGENVAAGYPAPGATVEAWMASAGHRANILNSNFTDIGVGWYVDGNGKSWAVQVFAAYTRSTPPTTPPTTTPPTTPPTTTPPTTPPTTTPPTTPPAATKPSIPSKPVLSAGSVADTSLKVSWTAPNNGGSAITEYNVSLTKTSDGTITNVTTKDLSYEFKGLTSPNASYTATVSAKNSVGTSSVSTKSVAFKLNGVQVVVPPTTLPTTTPPTTPPTTEPPAPVATKPAIPSKPVLTTGTVYGSSVVASWNAPSSDGGSAITGYKISLTKTATGEVTTFTTTDTSFEFKELGKGSYTATVTAINAAGSSSSGKSVAIKLAGGN